jgi:hypothetical protein
MSTPIVIEGTIALRRNGHAGRQEEIPDRPASTASPPSSRVPRIARLMGLALHVEALVGSGTISSYAEVARIGHVSRARVSQIVSLVQLAPDLQEHLLFLKRPGHGRESLPLRHVLSIAAFLEWDEQRRLWRKLLRARRADPHLSP